MSGDGYLWLKAFHIIAVIAWMAGMLYLPRLFVYHACVQPKSASSELLKTMERRLLRFIMNPAMILTWGLGITLAFHINAFSPENGRWLHWKLLLVLLMSALHGLMARRRKQFAIDANTKSARYYKILNESVTVLVVAIVILAVVKPL